MLQTKVKHGDAAFQRNINVATRSFVK
jgi:hypothetical protein